MGAVQTDRSIQLKAYYEENKEAILETSQTKYCNNPNEKRSSSRIYYKKQYEVNPHEKKATSKKQYELNPQEKKATSKKQYELNPQEKKATSKISSKKKIKYAKGR